MNILYFLVIGIAFLAAGGLLLCGVLILIDRAIEIVWEAWNLRSIK